MSEGYGGKAAEITDNNERLRTPNTSTDGKSAEPIRKRSSCQLLHQRVTPKHHRHHPLLRLRPRVKHPRHMHPSGSGSKQREAGRRVCRKYRQVYIRSLQQQEYDKLLNIVPTLASSRHKQRIPKVTVIEETIRYIDQLHDALAERVESETGGRLHVSSDAVAEAAKDMFIEDAAAAAAADSSSYASSSLRSRGSRCSVCDGSRTKTPEFKDGD